MNNQKLNLNLHSKVPDLIGHLFIILFIVSTFFVVQSVKSAEFILDPVKPVQTNTVVEPVFTRVLSVGNSGPDVKALQLILGIENNTLAETSGVFTNTTKNNVIKFQEKYPIDILIPASMTIGNGIVEQTTIDKLNQLAAKYNIKLNDFTYVPAATTTHVVNVFTRNLSLGDTGDDVTLLKSVLNSDKSTALVYPGNITPAGLENVFDITTQGAVIRFQEKYASEILTPSGLTAGNGVVGPSTRAKLNSILASFVTNTAKQDATAKSTVDTSATVKTNISLPTQNLITAPVNISTPTQYPFYYWSTGDWGSCSSVGKQSRTVTKEIIGYFDFPMTIVAVEPASTQNCTPTPIDTSLLPECKQRETQTSFTFSKNVTITEIINSKDTTNNTQNTPGHNSNTNAATNTTTTIQKNITLTYSTKINKASYSPGENISVTLNLPNPRALSLDNFVSNNNGGLGNSASTNKNITTRVALSINGTGALKETSSSGYFSNQKNISITAPKTAGGYFLDVNYYWKNGTSSEENLGSDRILFDVFDFRYCKIAAATPAACAPNAGAMQSCGSDCIKNNMKCSFGNCFSDPTATPACLNSCAQRYACGASVQVSNGSGGGIIGGILNAVGGILGGIGSIFGL